MNITVVGVGHVGLVTAGALARWGHHVVGMDDDGARIATLRRGAMPFFEPGLSELLDEGVEQGRLRYSDDLDDALADAEVVFVCVGTPSLPGGGPDLRFVERVAGDVAARAQRDLVLVEKSTVPADTGRRLEQVIEREQARCGSQVAIHVASNPEFLREGAAVEDTLHPDRIVYGTSSGLALEALRAVYRQVVDQDDCPVIETDVPTAELIKHASNAFLATRISFMNAVANIAERVGADVKVVARGMGLDERIGPHFLHAGLGYGGSCFPKDVDAFYHLAKQVGYDFALLNEVRRINELQRGLVVAKLESELWHLNGKTITLLGAAFKPGTDDLREAPALYIARQLLDEGANVRVYDPVALDGVAKQLPEVETYDDPAAAIEGAHAAVVCTEWDQIRALTPATFMAALDYPIVVDGRNVFEPDAMLAAGLQYHSVGRRSASGVDRRR